MILDEKSGFFSVTPGFGCGSGCAGGSALILGMGAEEQTVTFKTIRDIRGYTADLDAAVEQLNRDAAKVVGNVWPAWYSAFRTWRARWKVARAEADKSGAGITGIDVWQASRTMDGIKKWRAELAEWRSKMTAPKAAGGGGVKASGLAPRFGADAPPEPWHAKLPWLKIAIGATVLVVAFPLLSGLRRGAGALGSRMAPQTNPRRRRRR